MKLKFTVIALFLLLLFIPFFALKAQNDDPKGTVFISSEENITGNLLAAGDSVIVDGIIGGDLIVAANYITVSGRVEGDILAIGQNINIDGEVGGNIRVIGNTIIINGDVSRNVNAFGSQVIIGDNSRIGWDVILGGIDSSIRGNIVGSLDSYSQKTIISGKVGKNANIKVINNNEAGLIINQSAIINGDLNYSSKDKINLANSENISGEINWKEINTQGKSPFSNWAWEIAFSFLSVLFIGLFFVFITPYYSRGFILEIKNKKWKPILIGALFTLITIPLAVVIAFTIIGLPLSLILLSLWLAGLFIGKTIAAIILGELITTKILKKNNIHLFWPLLIGALVLSLLFSIPWFGWIINLVFIWLGLGSVLSYVANKPKNI
jgi:hypothetical protein